MTSKQSRILLAVIGSVSTLLGSHSVVSGALKPSPEDSAVQMPAEDTEKLEALIFAYTNVYYALGACDGFITPEKEAPFDPYGPMLAKWPDSFKRQMAETREEGRIEAAKLARQHRFTFEDRALLCEQQLDSANSDLAKVRVRYGQER